MARNRKSRKAPLPTLKDLDPATLDKLAQSVAAHLHALQTAQPAPSTELVAAKETLPAIAETGEKRSRPALVFLGLVQGGLKTVKGTLKLAQSTFCKDIESDWMKNNVEGLLAVGIGVTLAFVRPHKPLENTGESIMAAKMIGQPLGKLVITRLDSALGWSRVKIEKYEAAIEAMKLKPLAKPKDAAFADVDGPPDTALSLPASDNLRMFPSAKPETVAVQDADHKAQQAGRRSKGPSSGTNG